MFVRFSFLTVKLDFKTFQFKMRRKHKSVVLAQCDSQITFEVVCREGRDIECMVDRLPHEEYKNLIENDTLNTRFDCLLTLCYSQCKEANFDINFDSFGGYGLFYEGDAVFKPGKNCPTGLWAILEYIDHEDENLIKPISVFKSTAACKKSRIMVGAVRFAKNCCVPNCEYVITEWNGVKCIQLKVIKEITKGDELFVFYGSDFFEAGNSDCKCPFAHLHRTADVEPVSYTHAAIQRKTSLIDSNFLNSVSRKRRRNFVQKRSREMTKFAEVRNFSSSSSSGEEPEVHFAQSREDHFDEQMPSQLEENRLEIPPRFLISTPNFSEIENLEVGDLSEIVPLDNNDAAVEPSCYSSSSEDEALPSESPNSNFEACVSFILAKHAAPDAEVDEWIKLIRALNPTQIIPSYKSLKRKYHLTHAD